MNGRTSRVVKAGATVAGAAAGAKYGGKSRASKVTGAAAGAAIGHTIGGAVSHPNRANAKTGVRTSKPASVRPMSRQPKKAHRM